MFENISPVFLALCGCSLLCGGAFVMLGFTLVSRVGLGTLPAIVTLISNFLSGRRETREVEEDIPRRSARKIPRAADLREKSQSLDFDAAVQQYRQQQNPPPITPPSASTNPLPDLGEANLPPRESRSNRMRDWRSRRRDDEAEDELLGGLDAMDSE